MRLWPEQVIVGDTLDFEVSIAEYSASDGWLLTYKLNPRSGGSVISVSANATPDSAANFRTNAVIATTAAWAAGIYSWVAYVAKSGLRHTVDSGQTTIVADPGAAPAGIDTRSHARKVVEAIEAVLEHRATQDQMEYTINGRSLRRTAIADLLTLRSQYKAELRREEQAQRASEGLPDRRRVYVRFNRA